MPNEIRLTISDGRRPFAGTISISEPFAPMTEDDIYHALDTLHLVGILQYPDGSTREFLPQFPSRVLERVYPPASGGSPEDKPKSCPS